MYTLNLLELFNLPSRSYDVETVHMIIESWKFAFSNRMALVRIPTSDNKQILMLLEDLV